MEAQVLLLPLWAPVSRLLPLSRQVDQTNRGGAVGGCMVAAMWAVRQMAICYLFNTFKKHSALLLINISCCS